MSRFKPLLALLLLQPLLLLLALVIWWWYERRQQEMVFTFIPEEPSDVLEKPEVTGTGPVITELPEDDLKKIEGIGPKISVVLKSAGITTYAQLADIDIQALDAIIKQAGIHNANPKTWPDQASIAAAGDWKSLESFQAKLKGGRPV